MSGVWDAAGPDVRLADRLHARLAAQAPWVPAVGGPSDPVLTGRPARGRHLIEGRLRLGGAVVDLPGGAAPWTLDLPPADMAGLHRFDWLDDLAAEGGRAAWAVARGWTLDWIRRFGRGTGPGWTPARTGRRLTAWIDHAAMIEAGPATRGHDPAFRRALGSQARFLARRWRAAPPGPPRIDALIGVLRAGLTLADAGLPVAEAAEALGQEGAAALGLGSDSAAGPVTPAGAAALPSRNPERLSELHARLAWAAATLTAGGHKVPATLSRALATAGPLLRGLRHADGGLVRMQGGGAGAEGRLDAALARVGGGPAPADRMAMGFARLSEGRVTLIADAAPPPTGFAGRDAHASTLAVEITAGRQPLVVSCGSGAPFGSDWRRAGRATASHSVLGLDGVSSSRLGAPVRRGGRVFEPLDRRPEDVARSVALRRGGAEDDHGARVLDMSHDGWRRSHGLIYRRRLALARDGGEIAGEEALAAETDRDVRALRAVLDRAARRRGAADGDAEGATEGGAEGIGFAVRFHLHPRSDAALDASGLAARVTLPSGEVWTLRHDGAARLSVEPSVYFDAARLHPSPSHQIVLAGRIEETATRLRWSLARGADQAPPDLEAPDEGV